MEGSGGTGPCIETHHIATICNDKSTARGGPWTPRFRRIFAKAGMSMEDPANKNATATCRSVVVCREALTARLRKLAKQIATPGTELNQLVTQSKPR